MKYEKIIEAKFIERPNRFIAEVEVDGKREIVHVKNTGRCKELLVPGSIVYLNEPTGGKRKTRFDLIAVLKPREESVPLLINLDSQAPNNAVAEWLPFSGVFSNDAKFYREVTYGSSRFDFMIEENGRKSYLEVKGVTLEENSVAMFPDAPTERGAKHLRELADLAKKGIGAYVLFLVQMKGVSLFIPNRKTDPGFAEALINAKKSGVKILSYDSIVSENSIIVNKPVNINLQI